MLGTGHSGRLAHKLSSRIIVRSSPAWAACLRVSGRSGIIGKLAHVACVAVGNATLDSTTLVNARLSGATADPATPTYPVACALPTIGKRSHFRITTLDLTEEEAALLLKQLNGIIDGNITSSQTARGRASTFAPRPQRGRARYIGSTCERREAPLSR